MINRKASFILLKHGNQRETWKDGSARNIERLKVDDFHPKQTRKEANFACGYTWAAKQRRGIKKCTLGKIIFLPSVFSSTKRLSTNWPYMWTFKRGFVRRLCGLILVRNVLECFNFYSVDLPK